MRTSIRRRLSSAFLALAVLPCLLVGLGLGWRNYAVQEQQALRLQSEMTRRVAAEVQGFFQQVEGEVLLAARSRGRLGSEPERQQGVLAVLIAHQRAFEELTLLDRGARPLAHAVRSRPSGATVVVDRSTLEAFTVALKQGRAHYGRLHFDALKGEPLLTLAVPVPDPRSGEIEAVLVAEVRLKSVWDIMADLQLARGQSAYIVDADDRVVAHQNPSVVLRGTAFSPPPVDGVHAGLNGSQAVLASTAITVGDRSLRIVVEQLRSDALGAAISAVHFTLATVAAMLVVAGGLGVVAVRQIVHPIQDLAQAAQAIRGGDLSRHVKVSTHDELGVLAEAFNSMTTQLRSLVGDLEQRVSERTARLQIANDRLQEEVAERLRAEASLGEQSRLLEMIAVGAPLSDVLEQLCLRIESQLSGQLASILLLDNDGIHLRCAAAPSLPRSYRDAIDGARIGPQVDPCGTPAHCGASVVVTDVACDPLWRDYRELAEAHGLRACWSAPVFATDGTVLGTFAMYGRTVGGPSGAERQLIDVATRLAGIAIERQRTETRIRYLAHHDALTDLPNRALLRDRLTQALAHMSRGAGCVTIAFIDLDNFKWVNDSLGHAAGDELLKTVAARLRRCVRGSDTVARLGGDEFVVLFCDQHKRAEELVPTLQNIIAAVAEPMVVGGRQVQVSCSIGLASSVGDDDITALLMNADAAMYRAKELGRNNFQFHNRELNRRSRERLALQEALRRAIDGDELFLLYQPQIELGSGRLHGVEALVRWRHPERGVVSPASFIPLAEETGLIVPLGDWVLRQACAQSRRWQDSGLAPISMSVNVSARQFREPTWIDAVARALHDTGLDPAGLELELTESMLMQDVDQAVEVMARLRTMGVHLALDDFGTGYSSLGALKRFPIGRLKIDQSFVRDIASDDDDKAIVMAIISLGHRMNMKVLAEGVETSQQATFLRDNACDEIQGYHIGRPMPAHDIEAWLRRARLEGVGRRQEPAGIGHGRA
ncbi:MAG TPA: EAL domain-containing protein [Burkholderiaceae bacterium]|nr:EAL domain-containing protein [Burkholderiaceae bacterium]